MNDKPEKHGARIFQVSDSVLLIKQTVKRSKDPNSRYVLDEQKECHVNINDDAEIADGIRNAIKGNLTAGKK